MLMQVAELQSAIVNTDASVHTLEQRLETALHEAQVRCSNCIPLASPTCLTFILSIFSQDLLLVFLERV